MHPYLRLSLVVGFAGIALSAPKKNITIPVPEGTTNHGDPRLLCPPARWYNVATFFVGNYFAHTATIRSSPGQTITETVVNTICALLFPTTGLARGLEAIARSANFGRDELQKALKAGALCMVVRTKAWKPEAGLKPINDLQIDRSALGNPCTWRVYRPGWMMDHEFASMKVDTSVVPPNRKIHGASRIFVTDSDDGARLPPPLGSFTPLVKALRGPSSLPSGYAYNVVPPDAIVSSLAAEEMSWNAKANIHITSSSSTAKILVAIAQSIYASSVLYRSRGDQIERYGYAAFSLTISPYVVMSIINLLGSLLTPEYPNLYLVRSDVLAELEGRYGTRFDGTIGTLVPPAKNAVTGGSRENTKHDGVTGLIDYHDGGNLSLHVIGPTRDPGPKPEQDTIEARPPQTPQSRVPGEHAPERGPKSEKEPKTETAVAESEAGEIHPTSTASNIPVRVEEPTSGPGSKPEPDTSRIRLALRASSHRRCTILVPACSRFRRANTTSAASSAEDSATGLGLTKAGFVNFRAAASFLLPIIIRVITSSISIAIIGGLSHFTTGKSTKSQRTWTMTWLVIGLFIGTFLSGVGSLSEGIPHNEDHDHEDFDYLQQLLLQVYTSVVAILYSAPAIGGFVVVGKMIMEYGNCFRID